MILKKLVFDLKTFSDVRVGIEFTPSADFTTLAEALAFYGNDESAILKALNADKLETEKTEQEKTTPIDQWHSFEDEEETILNGPADVQVGNDKMVNDLVLNLAKQHFGFSKDSTREEKRAAKAKAIAHIQENEVLRAALATMSAATMG